MWTVMIHQLAPCSKLQGNSELTVQTPLSLDNDNQIDCLQPLCAAMVSSALVQSSLGKRLKVDGCGLTQ
eukprot:4119657-Amphidinium_carterae.1